MQKPNCDNNGDFDQLASILVRLRPRVETFLRRRFHSCDESVVDDIWQQVLLAAWRNCGRLRTLDGRSLVQWLRCVARNRCIDEKRQESARRGAETAFSSESIGHRRPSSSSAPKQGTSELPAWLERALATLSTEKRELLQLRFWAGMTLNEIALRFGRSPANVAAISSRLLKSLRARADDKAIEYFERRTSRHTKMVMVHGPERD